MRTKTAFRQTLISLLALSFSLHLSLAASRSALKSPTFGWEWEFTNEALINQTPEKRFAPAFNAVGKVIKKDYVGDLQDKVDGLVPKLELEAEYREKYLEAVKRHLPANAKIEKHIGKFLKPEYKIYLPDQDWWFNISVDPSAVEIQTDPESVEDQEKIEEWIQRYVFDPAKEADLFVDEETGAGHVNIGAYSAFGDDGRLFAKFVADYFNHSELALGTLGYDLYNAPPLDALSEAQQEAMTEVMQDVANGKLVRLKDVAKAIQSRVYTATYDPKWGRASHYQALSVEHLTSFRTGPNHDAPLELRAVRAQQSAHDASLFAELFKHRIEFLHDEEMPFEYVPIKALSYSDSELASLFYVYTQEMGLDWKTYKTLMMSKLQKAKLDPFVLGKVDWHDPEYRAAARFHTERPTLSPWVKRMFEKASEHPSARGNGSATRIINAYKKRLDDEAERIASTRPALRAAGTRRVGCDSFLLRK